MARLNRYYMEVSSQQYFLFQPLCDEKLSASKQCHRREGPAAFKFNINVSGISYSQNALVLFCSLFKTFNAANISAT